MQLRRNGRRKSKVHLVAAKHIVVAAGKQNIIGIACIKGIGQFLPLVIDLYIGIDLAGVAVGDRSNIKIINAAVIRSECIIRHKVGAVHSHLFGAVQSHTAGVCQLQFADGHLGTNGCIFRAAAFAHMARRQAHHISAPADQEQGRARPGVIIIAVDPCDHIQVAVLVPGGGNRKGIIPGLCRGKAQQPTVCTVSIQGNAPGLVLGYGRQVLRRDHLNRYIRRLAADLQRSCMGAHIPGIAGLIVRDKNAVRRIFSISRRYKGILAFIISESADFAVGIGDLHAVHIICYIVSVFAADFVHARDQLGCVRLYIGQHRGHRHALLYRQLDGAVAAAVTHKDECNGIGPPGRQLHILCHILAAGVAGQTISPADVVLLTAYKHAHLVIRGPVHILNGDGVRPVLRRGKGIIAKVAGIGAVGDALFLKERKALQIGSALDHHRDLHRVELADLGSEIVGAHRPMVVRLGVGVIHIQTGALAVRIRLVIGRQVSGDLRHIFVPKINGDGPQIVPIAVVIFVISIARSIRLRKAVGFFVDRLRVLNQVKSDSIRIIAVQLNKLHLRAGGGRVAYGGLGAVGVHIQNKIIAPRAAGADMHSRIHPHIFTIQVNRAVVPLCGQRLEQSITGLKYRVAVGISRGLGSELHIAVIFIIVRNNK